MPVAKRKTDDNNKHSEKGRWLSLRCAFPMGCAITTYYVTCRVCRKEKGPFFHIAQAGRDGVCKRCRSWGLHHR